MTASDDATQPKMPPCALIIYPFSPRIRTLRAVLNKLRPEPVHEPLPAPKVYAAPGMGRYKRRRRG